MKSLLPFMILFLTTHALYEGKTSVQLLTSSSFSKVKTGIWLVQFYANWCGHCQRLAPQYEKAAGALKGIANLAAIDASTEQTGVDIKGYPTLKLYIDGVSTEYNGGRDAAAFVDFMLSTLKQTAKKRLGGQQREEDGDGGDDDVIVLTDSTFEKMVYGDEKAWFVEFYAPWCGHCKSLAPIWAQLATALKGDVKVAKLDATANTKYAEKFGVKGYPTLKFFPPGHKDDDSAVPYEGSRTLDAMLEWAQEQIGGASTFENIQITSQSIYDEQCKAKNHLCIISFLPNILDSSEEERATYLDKIKSVALKHKGKIFKFLWTQGGDHLQTEQTLGVSGLGYPVLVFVYHAKNIYGRLRGAFSQENIEEFVEKIKNNKQPASKIGKQLVFRTIKHDEQL